MWIYINVIVRGHPEYIRGFPIIIKPKRFVQLSALNAYWDGGQTRALDMCTMLRKFAISVCVGTFGPISNKVEREETDVRRDGPTPSIG